MLFISLIGFSTRYVIHYLQLLCFAVLYKVFMVGTRYHTVTRPSITTKKLLSKNVDVYHFHSDTVSKITEAASSVQHVSVTVVVI